MTIPFNPHAYLLSEQLASTFKAMHYIGFTKSHYIDAKPLIVDSKTVINFSVADEVNLGKNAVTVTVSTENTVFYFMQWYHYGLLNELEIRYSIGDEQTFSFHEVLVDSKTSDELKSRLLIDFEYAISIYTEHIANFIKV